MKLNKIFAAFMLIAAVAFTACQPQNPPTPNPGDGKDTTTVIPSDTTQIPTDTTTTTTPGDEIEIDYLDGEISVAKALEMGANLASGDTTDYIKVRGLVKFVKTVSLSYGNAQFYLTDDGNNELYCYNIKGVDGEKFVSGEQLKEGDIVTVEARLYNYASADGDLLELIKGNLTRTTNTFDPSQATGPKEVTVAEAYAEGSKLEQGVTSSEQYQVTGVITEVTEASTSYGNLTFNIKDEDGTQEMICYRLYYLDNNKYTEDDPALEPGDVVTIIAQIKNHYEKIEFVSGYLTEHIK
jgi:hypothetical protein